MEEYILIAIVSLSFGAGHVPTPSYLGTFKDVAACQGAAKIVRQQLDTRAVLICTPARSRAGAPWKTQKE